MAGGFDLAPAELTALFKDGYDIVEDHVPAVFFDPRVGQERVRALRRSG